jgi:hypothetical protein
MKKKFFQSLVGLQSGKAGTPRPILNFSRKGEMRKTRPECGGLFIG